MFKGSIASTKIHPSEVVREALLLNAAAVIVSHNHPSFSPEPSRADSEIMLHLNKALELVGVKVIDQ